jgi:hypothetical protein
MFALVAKALAIVALAVQVASAAVTPFALQDLPKDKISQCGSLTFRWNGGEPDFNVFLLSNVGGSVIKAFPMQSGHHFDWTVNLHAGTQFVLQVISSKMQDGTTPILTSGLYTILPSDDTSCIDTSVVDNGHGGQPGPTGQSSVPAATTSTTTTPTPTTVPKGKVATNNNSNTSNQNYTVPIVAGILGGLVGILLVVFALLWNMRRRVKTADGLPQLGMPAGKVVDEEAGPENFIEKPHLSVQV